MKDFNARQYISILKYVHVQLNKLFDKDDKTTYDKMQFVDLLISSAACLVHISNFDPEEAVKVFESRLKDLHETMKNAEALHNADESKKH